MENIHKLSEIEFGRNIAASLGKTNINDETAKKYAMFDYYHKVRDLLEKQNFDSVQDLFDSFYSLYCESHSDAKKALETGFHWSLLKREFSNSPYKFENDKDFIQLKELNLLDTTNQFSLVLDYFLNTVSDFQPLHKATFNRIFKFYPNIQQRLTEPETLEQLSKQTGFKVEILRPRIKFLETLQVSTNVLHPKYYQLPCES